MKYPRVYYIMMIIGFALIAGGGMSRAFLPLLGRELDPSGLLIGFAMSSYHFARTFLEIPSGFISDKIGRRKPVIFGLGLSAIGALICSFSVSIYHLIIGRSLWGLGAALYFTNNIAFVIDLFEPSIRGRALGTLHGIEMIGSLIGQPAGAFLADLIGFKNVFYFSCATIGIGFAFSLISKDLKQSAIARSSNERLPFRSAMAGLKNKGLFLISLVRMIRMILTMGVMMTAFPIFLNDEIHLSVGLIGVAMTMRTVGFILSTFSGGHLSDRFGTKPVAIVGIFLECITFYAYTVVTKPELIYILVFLGGLGSGLFQISISIIMTLQVEEKYVGAAVGLYRTFQDMGSVVGPILVMLFVEIFDVKSAFLVGLAAYLVALPLLILTPKGRVVEE